MPNIPLLTVCRGCCCGADPAADPAPTVLFERLGAACGDAARVRTSDCLGPCDRSDVVVVVPSSAGRDQGARNVWISRVVTADVIDGLASWVRAGGPGFDEPPPVVRARIFRIERAGAGRP